MAQRQGGSGGLHGGSNFADIYDVAEYQPDILRPLQPKVTSQDVFILFSWCACLLYRPGQPTWEYTMWKFQVFSASQILREINLVIFEPQKLPF